MQCHSLGHVNFRPATLIFRQIKILRKNKKSIYSRAKHAASQQLCSSLIGQGGAIVCGCCAWNVTGWKYLSLCRVSDHFDDLTGSRSWTMTSGQHWLAQAQVSSLSDCGVTCPGSPTWCERSRTLHISTLRHDEASWLWNQCLQLLFKLMA